MKLQVHATLFNVDTLIVFIIMKHLNSLSLTADNLNRGLINDVYYRYSGTTS